MMYSNNISEVNEVFTIKHNNMINSMGYYSISASHIIEQKGQEKSLIVMSMNYLMPVYKAKEYPLLDELTQLDNRWEKRLEGNNSNELNSLLLFIDLENKISPSNTIKKKKL